VIILIVTHISVIMLVALGMVVLEVQIPVLA